MLNRLIKLISNHFNLSEDKPRVLIFGASKGGESVYRALQDGYNIIGFLDNNVKVQGRKLFGEIIYSPIQLAQLEFDKIIIASDYHKEIKKQLINEFHITTENIEIFNLVEAEKATLLFRFFDYVKGSAVQLLCNIPFTIAHSLLTLFSAKNDQHNYISLKQITWLDQLETHKIKIFLPEKKCESSSPHFIGEKEKTSSIIVPEVSLYHFEKGVVMTNVNAIVFGDNEIAIGRVPSFPVKYSQYDAGFLASHGTKNALIKEHSTEVLEKGIAIVGSNDENYYHWIIEVLSKFQFVAELPEEYESFPILISKKMLEIESIKEFVSCFFVKRKFIYLQSCIEYQVEDLLFISSTNYFVANLKNACQWSASSNFIREESLEFLRCSVIKAFDKLNEFSTISRVFLARKGVIRDYNQAEVFDLLSLYGFEAVYLEDLSLLQQVRLMQGADFIVGPTGAAWTNMIFCNEETQALCWMAEEAGDFTCFSDIAQFSGVNMEYLRYKIGNQNTRSLYYAAYSIHIKHIKQWLISKDLKKVIEDNNNNID